MILYYYVRRWNNKNKIVNIFLTYYGSAIFMVRFFGTNKLNWDFIENEDKKINIFARWKPIVRVPRHLTDCDESLLDFLSRISTELFEIWTNRKTPESCRSVCFRTFHRSKINDYIMTTHDMFSLPFKLNVTLNVDSLRVALQFKRHSITFSVPNININNWHHIIICSNTLLHDDFGRSSAYEFHERI